MANIAKLFRALLRSLLDKSASEPQAPAALLFWRFGGFDGARAVEDPAVRIADLRVSSGGLSYRWETPQGLSAWGLARGQADAIAAAFYWDDARGNWIGGKFDWISTSRTTRDFKNISAGYHGWDSQAFFAARKIAFCIVSRDGARRSNIVEAIKK